MEWWFQLGIGLVFGIIVSLIARSRGRNAIGWFFVGFFTGCIGLIILLVLPDLKLEQAKWKAAEERTRRLKEQLRQEQLKSSAFQQHVTQRLDVHDDALGMNTRQIGSAEGQSEPMLGQVPDPKPDFAAVSWFYILNEKQFGPVGFDNIQALYRQGTLNGNTLVWNERMEEWKMIQQIPDLEANLL